MEGKPKSIDTVVKESWEYNVSAGLTYLGGALTLFSPLAGVLTFAGGAAWHLKSNGGNTPLEDIWYGIKLGYKLNKYNNH